MKESIKEKILSYLGEKKKFVAGGVIEDYIRQTTEEHHKASNASRRLRELLNEGKIEAIYENIPNIPNKVVYYRIVQYNLNGVRIK